MARQRKYEDTAEKQRAYRRRKRLSNLSPAERRFDEVIRLNYALHLAARAGDPVAAQIAGDGAMDTALNFWVFLGDDALKFAQQVAFKRMASGKTGDVNS
jgi:hypothetical protein